MFNFVRKIVAGPKNRTVDESYDLDLTYITNNIIAMAFPATGFEKAYRNSINDVSTLLHERHGEHYLIINASNRKYDYEKFNYQVLEYFWTDHQAPPLTTLFELCEKIESFLQRSKQNVVAVHCNHGKGRTGTAIISYLLYSYQFTDVKQALDAYNVKRFSDSKYAVDQPCQLRYLKFFKNIHNLSLQLMPTYLKAFKLSGVYQSGLPTQKQIYLRISDTRTQHVIYPSVFISQKQIKFVRPLMGDIFIQLLQNLWTGTKQHLRINYNLFFLQKIKDSNKYSVLFQGNQISMKKSQKKAKFLLKLQFEQFCHCYEHSHHHKKQCLCISKRQREQGFWNNMIKIIVKNRNRHKINQQQLKNVNQQIQSSENLNQYPNSSQNQHIQNQILQKKTQFEVKQKQKKVQNSQIQVKIINQKLQIFKNQQNNVETQLDQMIMNNLNQKFQTGLNEHKAVQNKEDQTGLNEHQAVQNKEDQTGLNEHQAVQNKEDQTGLNEHQAVQNKEDQTGLNEHQAVQNKEDQTGLNEHQAVQNKEDQTGLNEHQAVQNKEDQTGLNEHQAVQNKEDQTGLNEHQAVQNKEDQTGLNEHQAVQNKEDQTGLNEHQAVQNKDDQAVEGVDYINIDDSKNHTLLMQNN